MGKRLTLHIQQNTTLERVGAIVEYLGDGDTDIEKLAAVCQIRDSVIERNIFPFLRNLGILEKNNPPKLTNMGEVAAKIHSYAPALLGDFLHWLIYQLYGVEPDKRFSWAYRAVGQKLWQRQEVVLSSGEKKSLVSETISMAAEQFNLATGEIAFSESSITGILNWLRGLNPPVIEGEGKSLRFSNRYFCAAPILLKAIDTLSYQHQQRPYGLKVFLRPDIKDDICQMLLLAPDGLEGSLENAKRTYDYEQGGLFDWGFEGGYGEWIMLARSPDWNQLI